MAALEISSFQMMPGGPMWQASCRGQTFASLANNSPFQSRHTGFTSAVGPAAATGANVIYADVLEIAPAASLTLDLKAIKDISGQTQGWARLKYLFAFLLEQDGDYAITEQSNRVTLGAASSNGHLLFLNAAADRYVLRPGQRLEIYDPSPLGVEVTTTARLIELSNADTVRVATVSLVLAGGLS